MFPSDDLETNNCFPDITNGRPGSKLDSRIPFLTQASTYLCNSQILTCSMLALVEQALLPLTRTKISQEKYHRLLSECFY